MRMTLTMKRFSVAILATMLNPVYADEQKHHFDIPAQPLSSALKTLAKQSGAPMLYAEQTAAGRRSPGLSGTYTTSEATGKLLAGSVLSYRVAADGTVTVKPAPAPQKSQPPSKPETTTFAPMTVVGKAEYDDTDPFNPDYVQPDATTGTRTDTPIMETPLDIQVTTKQVLKDQQVIRLDQALKNVSGVTTNTTNNFGGNLTQSILLRGFASQTFFRNGFRLQQGAASRAMANVESIEVLKGSAAVLYGLVDPGGMVNVITKQSLEIPYYSLNQQFGSYDLYRTTIDGGGVNMQDGVVSANNAINSTGYALVGMMTGYALVGMMTGYTFEVGKSRITAQLNVDNLLNKSYFTNGVNYGSNIGFVTFSTPRTFLESINIQY
jgi:iron complex outermembrane receptor protein